MVDKRVVTLSQEQLNDVNRMYHKNGESVAGIARTLSLSTTITRRNILSTYCYSTAEKDMRGDELWSECCGVNLELCGKRGWQCKRCKANQSI